MYSLGGHGEMAADAVRMGAYREALRCAIRPGCTVVDLGAGAGILSLLAVKLGAGRVFAIEPDDVIGVAREIARANGLADRIEFIQQISERVQLPERVDVVVADLRGVLPPWTGHFRAIGDARARLLKPGGTLIPSRDTLWAAAVETPRLYDELLHGWSDGEFDMAAGRRRIMNSWMKVQVEPEHLLTGCGRWAAIDYATVAGPAVHGAADLRVLRPGTAHGLALWFDAVLIDDVGFSNAPGRPRAIYGQAFFPLAEAAAVEEGGGVAVEVRADFAEGDYVWSWDTTIRSAGGEVTARFRQSTFHHLPLSPDKLRKRAHAFVPGLNRDGEIDRMALGLFGTGRTLGEIAAEVAAAFPDRFKDWKSALDRVASLSGIYGD